MKFIYKKELSQTEKKEIIDLWNNEYPIKLNFQTLVEFDKYLKGLTEQSHILMVNEKNEIKGWYFDFIRENMKWFAIILNPNLQGKGFGTKILNLAKEKETELNGWVIDHSNDKKKNGEFYKTPIDFYLKNRFEKITKSRLELKNISAVKIKWKTE